GRAYDAPAEAPSSPARTSGQYGYSAEPEMLAETASEDTDRTEDLLPVSVAASERPKSSAAPPVAPPPPPSGPAGVPGREAKQLTAAPEPAPPQTLADVPRVQKAAPLLIYSATLTLAVFGLDAALDAVEELARQRHGYLVRRNDASITVRVPAAVFRETLAGIGKVGDELHRDVAARDVTEEYADLEVRLRNAEVVRQRLEILLAKASKVEDALAVERELDRVTGTIEQLKGKLKLMSELVAFSTITVNFQPRVIERIDPRSPLPFEWLKELGLSNLLAL
ncbi:MAG TPA: DUF4349 domain-containing protein, partial [Polyangiaceae bacterium]